MFQEHPEFAPPPADAVLWRYLDLKLMEVVDSRGSLVRGRSDGRQRAAAQDTAPPGGASPRRGGDRQRGGDVPLLRHQPADVLQVAATASRSWAPTGSGIGRRARTTAPGPRRPRWSPRSCICASSYHFGPLEDRHVPQALPRHRDVLLGGVEDPGPTWPGKASGEPALQAPQTALEAVREAPARPPGADRREVHRPHRWRHRQKALPPHRHR